MIPEYSESEKKEVKELLKKAVHQETPTEISYEKIAKTFPSDKMHPDIPNCPFIHGNDLPDFLEEKCKGLKVQGFGKQQDGLPTVIFFRKSEA